jgi:mRNA interferase RelE/StbE
MSKYNVLLTKSAEKELYRLPQTVIKKLVATIGALADNPRPVGCKKLKGFKNLWRIRIGNYRIIYAIEEVILLVEVRAIGDRKDIYD